MFESILNQCQMVQTKLENLLQKTVTLSSQIYQIGFFDFKIGKLKIFSTIWLITIVIFLCRESNPKANGYGKLENYK